MIYFPIIYRNIPCSFDDSMSYYSQLLAINKVLSDMGDEIGKIEEAINTIQDSILTDVKHELETLLKQIEKELAELQNYVSIEITELKDEVEKSLQSMSVEIEKFKSDVNTDLENFKLTVNNEILVFKLETEGKLNDLDLKFNAQLDELDARFDNKITDVREEIDGIRKTVNAIYSYIDKQNLQLYDKLKEYCDEIYKSRVMYYVTNPITEKVQNVNTVLRDLWDSCNNALTAEQYAYLGLTAGDYEKLRLTCSAYLRELKYMYLEKKFHDSLNMWNTFTGRNENVTEVVKELIRLHEREMSMTAQDYADLQLTAQQYADLNITAYDYYVHGREIFKPFITTAEGGN